MSFVSLAFLVFLPIVFAAHWMARGRTLRNAILVVASYGFYAWWDWRFCSLMLISSLVDFSVGLGLRRTDRPASRRMLLATSLLVNLGMLGFFKYAGFFVDSWVLLLDQLGFEASPRTWSIVLPVGISFYTFQTMSYTIDVYRRQFTATGRLIDYMAYVSFFPQLVAGPIERAGSLLPQFLQDRTFDYEAARDGLRQILWGFAKKMVIADNLGMIVDSVFAHPENHAGPVLAVATLGFSFQVYCDFSGYSDIAIGTGRLFGVRLMRNFAYPFFSQSMAEFWRRWHISLATWFRDYMYIPLGGSRVGPGRRVFNIMLTFIACGFWHGAWWNYVFWGAFLGLTVIPSVLRRAGPRITVGDVPGGTDPLPRPAVLLRMLWTFFLFNVSLAIFRAQSVADIPLIFGRIARDVASVDGYRALYETVIRGNGATFTAVILLVVIEWIQRRKEHVLELPGWPRAARWIVYTALLYAIITYGTLASGMFIYFQF